MHPSKYHPNLTSTSSPKIRAYTSRGAGPMLFPSKLGPAPASGSYGWIYGIYHSSLQTCKPGSHLHYALSAASLAAFGNRPSCRQSAPSQSLSAKASLLYAKALESTNKALRDPLLVKKDETLAAVLMLGFFEVCRIRPLSTR